MYYTIKEVYQPVLPKTGQDHHPIQHPSPTPAIHPASLLTFRLGSRKVEAGEPNYRPAVQQTCSRVTEVFSFHANTVAPNSTGRRFGLKLLHAGM